MVTPRMGQRPAIGEMWAADTGCFASPHEFSFARYLVWLKDMAADGLADSCLFATAPDAFGDAARTLELARPCLPCIRDIGYRAALVAQPWMTAAETPWDEFDVLFIGGPNEWQHSTQIEELVREARTQGKPVHMGRVNGLRRMRYAVSLGCDSADGTFLRYGPDVNAPRLARWLEDVERAPSLWQR